MSAPPTLIVDTNVIIDAFVRAKDARSKGSIELIRRIEAGEFAAILPAPVLIEIYYVVLDITHDPERAKHVLRILLNSPHFTPRRIEIEDALQAIRYYRQFNYFPVGHGKKYDKRTDVVSLVDCLILALGKTIPNSIVCSNEGKFVAAHDIRVARPWELVREKGDGGEAPGV